MYRDLYRYKLYRYKSRYIAKGGQGGARHQKPVCCNWTSSDLPTYVQLLLTYLVESKATVFTIEND